MRNPWVPRERHSLVVAFALWLAKLARPVLRVAGVEEQPFRELLALRIRLDLRAGEGLNRITLPLVLSMSWLSGIVPGAASLLIEDPFRWCLLEMAWTMGFLGLALLLQLGNLLVDPTDLELAGPLPVSEATLYAARITHAFTYISLLAVCVHFWPVFLCGFRLSPWGPLALLPVAALSTLFVVAAVAGLFALILRVFGPQRFRRITLWLQVTVAAMGMGGLHLMRGLIDFEAVVAAIDRSSWLLALFPPAPFAGLFAVLTGNGSAFHGQLALLALAVPPLLFVVATRLASRNLISGLLWSDAREPARRSPWGPSPFQRLGTWVARTRVRRAGYDYALAHSRRESVFLRAAYTQVFGIGAMAFSTAMISSGAVGEWNRVAAPFALYVLPLLVPTLMELAAATEEPGRFAMLKPLPLDAVEEFYAGAVLGVLFGTALPAALGIALVASLMSGAGLLGDVAFAAAFAFATSLFFARRMAVPMPFSRAMTYVNVNAPNLPVVLGAIVAVACNVGIHAGLRFFAAPFHLALTPLFVLWCVREYRALAPALARHGTRADLVPLK
ncbi:MAG: hypothetical protein AAF682_24275 [Planctomycetota bacterium]